MIEQQPPFQLLKSNLNLLRGQSLDDALKVLETISCNRIDVRRIFEILSTKWTGRRMVLD